MTIPLTMLRDLDVIAWLRENEIEITLAGRIVRDEDAFMFRLRWGQ